MGVSKGTVTGSINRCKSHDSIRSMASFLSETRPFRKCKAGGRGQHTAKLVAGEVTLQMCCACMIDMTVTGLFPTVLIDFVRVRAVILSRCLAACRRSGG